MGFWAAYLRADSALRLARGERVLIMTPQGAAPLLSVLIDNDYLASPADALPRGLRIEVRAESKGSLEEVVDQLLDAGGQLLPLLTLAGNAFVGDVHLDVAYEVTPSIGRRPWIQRYAGRDEPSPATTRPISHRELGPLIEAANTHPGRDRWGRAVANYREALRHWRSGDELMAVEHLQIAAETMTPLSAARVVKASGKTKEAYAAEFGFDPTKGNLESFLASRVRLDEIYGGDNALRRDVESASNGFEHGFKDFTDAKALAESSRDRAARLIRMALLREVGLDQAAVQTLASGTFEVPLGLVPIQHLWRGTLEVDDEGLLDPGEPPLVLKDWRMKIIESKEEASGQIRMRTDHQSDGPPDGAKLTLEKKLTIFSVGLGEGAVSPSSTIDRVEVNEGESTLDQGFPPDPTQGPKGSRSEP
jgi:hypothetical protein